MELASFLAGERWSDHPACTHPLLAAVARHVNDRTSDTSRPRLGALIPTVIGLTSDDLHVDARIALRCARTALPVAAGERQRVMAVSILACERMLDVLDGRPAGTLEHDSLHTLTREPQAEHWARRFTRDVPPSQKGFRRHAAPSIVHYAIEGVARACVPDPDEMLYGLLVGAIDDCATWVRRDEPVETGVDGESWAAACALTSTDR